jgi:hypothetical protein
MIFQNINTLKFNMEILRKHIIEIINLILIIEKK